jgi:hypothetical protein
MFASIMPVLGCSEWDLASVFAAAAWRAPLVFAAEPARKFRQSPREVRAGRRTRSAGAATD